MHVETRAARAVGRPAGRACPARVPARFRGRDALIVLDRLRAVDEDRLVKPLGTVDEGVQDRVLVWPICSRG